MKCIFARTRKSVRNRFVQPFHQSHSARFSSVLRKMIAIRILLSLFYYSREAFRRRREGTGASAHRHKTVVISMQAITFSV